MMAEKYEIKKKRKRKPDTIKKSSEKKKCF